MGVGRPRSNFRLILHGFAAAACVLIGGLASPDAPADAPDRNIILVTLDGVRIQELFAGMDPLIAANEADSGIY